jgi:hypothetical protein
MGRALVTGMAFADAGSMGLARFVALISPPETLLRRRTFVATAYAVEIAPLSNPTKVGC